MSLPRRRNVIPVLLALAIVALTLVGANHLIHPEPTQAGGNPPTGRGLVVHGTVSAAPLANYGLSETMQVGKIRKVVPEYTEVQTGTVLIEFDDTLAKIDLANAESGVKVAGDWLAPGPVTGKAPTCSMSPYRRSQSRPRTRIG